MSSSALFRLSSTSFNREVQFTSDQALIDGTVTHFLEESAHGSTLLSIVAGGGAARLARTGILALGANATGRAALVVQGVAAVGSLGAEVLAFEGASRGLTSLSGSAPPNPNLWRWSGEGSFGQGLLTSGITFGALRGAGHAAQGQNIVFQHTAQSLAMVAGHNIAGALRIIPTPEGSLTQQFFSAEVTNIQLAGGMAFVHGMAPGLHSVERSLDLANQSRISMTPRGESEGGPPIRTLLNSYTGAEVLAMVRGSVLRSPRRRRDPLTHLIVESSSLPPDGKGKDPSLSGESTDVDSIPTQDLRPSRPPSPPSSVKEVEARDTDVRDPDFSSQTPPPPPVNAIPPPPPVPPDPREAETRLEVPPDRRLPRPPVIRVRGESTTLNENPQSRTDVDTRVHTLAEVTRLPPEETGLHAGDVLESRYEILDYIGSGGFGHVIKVRDRKFDRFLALKVLREERDTAENRRRFQNEVRIMGNLNPRWVVGVHDLIQLPNGRSAVVMDFVPGHDLSDIFRQLPISSTLDIFIKICEGVDSAHHRGNDQMSVIHRDLKLSNVRHSDAGDVKIMDWGLGKAFEEIRNEPPPDINPDLLRKMDHDLTPPGALFGSPGHIAPESFLGLYRDNLRTVDVFALGTILYEMITGRQPFTHGKTTADEKFYSTRPDRYVRPAPFHETLQGNYPKAFYERLEEVCLRAMELDADRRYQSARELREALLMVWTHADMDHIRELRGEMETLEAKMHEAWDQYRVDRQISPELEEQMEGRLYELIEKKQGWHHAIDSLVFQLTRLTGSDPNPEARKMIAELSWIRLIDGGDLMPKGVRNGLMDRIREYDTVTENEAKTSMKDALDGSLRLNISARDLVTQKPFSGGLGARVIPIEEYEPGFFRESSTSVDDPLHLRAGYYVLEISHPDYAFMRVPLHITLPQVRNEILGGEPFRLNLDLIPRHLVPKDFYIVHGGEGIIGHNIHRFGDPSLVISFPERHHPFSTFAATNPISVDQYSSFIQERLQSLNGLIAGGRFEEALRDVEQVREFLPRNQARVAPRSLQENPDFENLLATAFEGVRYHWRVTQTGEGRSRRYSLVNPSSHRMLPTRPNHEGDPIYGNQPINAISYLGAEGYTIWRSQKSGRNYQIISAEQKEIIARPFGFTYPWGNRFRRTFLASRLVHRDLLRDTHAHPIGTHPLGPDLYRDFSIYGGRNRRGVLQRLVDLLGNVREWTRTPAEENSVIMSGGSVRTPSGNWFLPSARTYVPKDVADEYNGTFRLGLEFPLLSLKDSENPPGSR